MKKLFAATAATAIAALSAAPAWSATQVYVRVEGKSTTLAEGPLLADGHDVRATSDTQARRCDGTNNGAHGTPGVTATSAAVDLLSLGGMTFDGDWFVGFDDYFITQFGPDRQDDATAAYWGVLDNGQLTPVGGCQWQTPSGHEDLWAYDAFNGRPYLKLATAGDGTWPPSQLTPTVAVGAPLMVSVVQSDGGSDTGTPASLKASPNVSVAPVNTDANGQQTVLVDDPAAVKTDAAGMAQLTFAAPGWHRIKAQADGFVRSNRLDVCVGSSLASCGPVPADAQVRQWSPADPGAGGPGGGGATTTPSGPAATPTAPASEQSTARPSTPALALRAVLVRSVRRGRVSVRWRVTSPGTALSGWRIESRTVGVRSWTSRARGQRATQAAVALPAGRVSDLRIVAVDALGRTTITSAGRVTVPLDDRAPGVKLTGFRKATSISAWKGTVSRGSRGARAVVTLAKGRPTLVLIGGGRARVQLRSHARTQTLTVNAASRPRTVTAQDTIAGGTVVLKVLSGSIALDGVAATP